VNKQVFWLRGRPTSFALPLKKAVAREAFVTRYSGATARDLHPLPYSPQTVVEALVHVSTHNNCVKIKELPTYSVFIGVESTGF